MKSYFAFYSLQKRFQSPPYTMLKLTNTDPGSDPNSKYEGFVIDLIQVDVWEPLILVDLV